MTSILFLQMILGSLGAVFLYTIIGFIPGTDETAVLMPVSLALILSGAHPMIVLSFFMSAVVTLNLTNLMPTALVGLPGGVMSSPMIPHAIHLKNRGLSAVTVKKMASGALLGILLSVPVSFLLANALIPFASIIQPYAPLLFVGGAIFLALIGKNKLLALLSILPLSILFMSLRHLYWSTGIVSEGTNITTSFFLGITSGPLILSLMSLLNKDKREKLLTNETKKIELAADLDSLKTLNPLTITTKKERTASMIPSLLSTFLFVLSPVGLVILFGDLVSSRISDPDERSMRTITVMSALTQSTYLSGLIIPILALGIPLSPVSVGPGNALFNAPPVFSVNKNIFHVLTTAEKSIAILVGISIATTISYILINRFAGRISKFVLEKIPHEAILALFVAFVVLLAYMDAGWMNVFGVLLIGLACGTLNDLGVNYGIQFMTLYASPWIISQLSMLSK